MHYSESLCLYILGKEKVNKIKSFHVQPVNMPIGSFQLMLSFIFNFFYQVSRRKVLMSDLI